MRRVAQFQDEPTARLLMRVLYGNTIESKLDYADGVYELWVLDDDQVSQAKVLSEQLNEVGVEQFKNLHAHALQQAKANDRKREAKLKAKAAEVIDVRTQAARRPVYEAYVCGILFALSALVAINTYVGENRTPLLNAIQLVNVDKVQVMELTYPSGQQELKVRRVLPENKKTTLTEYVPLTEIANGQLWRLVTPIFLHFGPFHLLFNLMWVYSMATQIERTQGHWQLIWLTIVIAIFSNLTQYAWGTLQGDYWGSVNFGGLSGVIAGYVTYVWVQMKYAPQSRLQIDDQNMLIFLIWNALCLTGSVGNIANGAHIGGLVMGLILGGMGPVIHHRQRSQRLKKYRSDQTD